MQVQKCTSNPSKVSFGFNLIDSSGLTPKAAGKLAEKLSHVRPFNREVVCDVDLDKFEIIANSDDFIRIPGRYTASKAVKAAKTLRKKEEDGLYEL